MSSNERGVPGISYPEDIHKESVPVQKAMRMVFDNLYYLRKQTLQAIAPPGLSTANTNTQTPAQQGSSGGQRTITGSTSGNAVFSQPVTGDTYKVVIIYCSSLLGTATYQFPTAFRFPPQVLSQTLAGIVTTVTALAVTLTGTTSTGFIELSGY